MIFEEYKRHKIAIKKVIIRDRGSSRLLLSNVRNTKGEKKIINSHG